jgi:hypothetical protein
MKPTALSLILSLLALVLAAQAIPGPGSIIGGKGSPKKDPPYNCHSSEREGGSVVNCGNPAKQSVLDAPNDGDFVSKHMVTFRNEQKSDAISLSAAPFTMTLKFDTLMNDVKFYLCFTNIEGLDYVDVYTRNR